MKAFVDVVFILEASGVLTVLASTEGAAVQRFEIKQ
jgi:hypothetical protein